MQKWKQNEAPVSHFLMNGGVLHVDDQDAFLFDYLHELLKRNKMYIVEKRTEQFKFFVDLDYKSDAELCSMNIIDLAHGLNQITKNKCYIARTDIRKVGDQIKTGVHFHWPDLIVTKQEALKLRNQMIIKFPEYADSIDESVYTGSGLRMIWSYKMPEGNPYIPWKSVTVSGIAEHLPKDPLLETLKIFTIRVPDSTDGTLIVHVDSSPLEAFINRYIPGQERARILKLFVTRDGESIGAQTDSKFCSHIGRCHLRNHVWFWIKNDTLRQMCLDSDCKNYQGKEYQIPPSIKNKLII